MNVGDGKKSDINWLARVERDGTVENDYKSPEFGQQLASKLRDMSSGSMGRGAALHSNNVAIAYTHVYGFDIEGVGANANQVSRSGNQGSVAELRIPAGAGLLHKAFNIVVGPELGWKATATTTDFQSEAQAVTCTNAMQYYWEHEGVAALNKSAAFEAFAWAEAGMHIPWDKSLGPDAGVDPERNQILHEGDASFRPVSTWDILRDPSARSFRALDWIVIREWPNKFDVAESCEDDETRDAVLAAGVNQLPVQGWAPWLAENYVSPGDRIPVYYLYCKRTPSVPAGRQTKFLQDGTILEDGPLDEAYVGLPPECIGPFAPIRAGEYAGTPWPFTKFSSACGAGQAADSVARDILTNITAVTGPVIYCEDDNMDLSPAQVGGGPRMLYGKPGAKPPVPLQLQAAQPDHFKFFGTLRNEQREILGVDQLTAGTAEAMPSSGALAALMTSTSVQNNSQWQALWAKFNQACGNILLAHIKHHMSTERQIALAGNARSSLVITTSLSKEKVSAIQRVLCSIGSAFEQTDAGRLEIATMAMDKGWVQTPEQWQAVRDTGRLDPLHEALSNKLLLIKHENERLAKGENPVVLLEDDHALHIKEHASVLASITARETEAVVLAVQAHNDYHLRMLREADPQLLAYMGQQSAAMPTAPGATSATPPPSGEPKPPEAPSMPTNPSSGEKAEPAGGMKPPALAIKPN